MTSMKTPQTRAEFEHGFHLLSRQIKDEKFHLAQGLTHALDGLARVRFLPNGRIDFLSVNESARLLANTQNQFDDESFQEQMKEHQASMDITTAAKESDLLAKGRVT